MMRALVLASLALAAAACGGCGEDPPLDPPPVPGNGDAPAIERFTFRWRGSRPWNDTVYVSTGAALQTSQPLRGHILGQPGEFLVGARAGDAYVVSTEPVLTDAERAMLWHLEVRGELESSEAVTLVAPSRAFVRLEAEREAGPDELVLYDEESGTSGSALRDEAKALFLCAWKGRDGNSYRLRAPPRPWICDEFLPGPCVVAARTRGRQWVAVRADLSPGGDVRLAVGAAPEGGGTVICEDENALLVLGDELPIPAPRIRIDLAFRATWNGVPPGEHVVRYSDGHEVDVTVEDGGEVKLPDR